MVEMGPGVQGVMETQIHSGNGSGVMETQICGRNGSDVMETQICGRNGSGCSGCNGDTNTQWKWVRCM